MTHNGDEHPEDSGVLDRLEIQDLVRMERFHRDRGEWELLVGSYVADACIRTTWFEGSPREFADASRTLADNGRHSTHLIAPMSIRIHGDRALVESQGEIHHRERLDGVEVDMIQYCRFFSRVRRTGDGWRLASFDGLYGKDVITPVNPADKLPFAWSELEHLRPSYRVWAYTLGRRGYDIRQDLPADDRPDLMAAFYREAQEWLTEAPAAGPQLG